MSYVPRRGDAVWLDFSPQAGHGQIGLRPVIVISPEEYSARAGLAVFCPVTSHAKGYPFEVPLPPGLTITGAVLADQVRNLDCRARGARFISSLPASIVQEVLGKLATLVA